MDPQTTPDHEDTPVHQEFEARRLTLEPARQPKPWLRWLAIGLIAAVFVAGVVAYMLVGRHHTSMPAAATTNSPSDQNQAKPDTVTDSSSKTYTSNGKDLNLSFAYPASWNVQPVSNNNADDKPITITSPLVTILSADGKSATGKVAVSIRPGGSTLAELVGDKATAAQASTQIAYDKPTSAQHQYPYISFIHVAGGPNPTNAFDEVIVTGVTNFNKDQAVYQTSLTQLDPIISARFYACGDQSCTAQTPLAIANSTWQNNDTCQQALAIFESLQIN